MTDSIDNNIDNEADSTAEGSESTNNEQPVDHMEAMAAAMAIGTCQ